MLSLSAQYLLITPNINSPAGLNIVAIKEASYPLVFTLSRIVLNGVSFGVTEGAAIIETLYPCGVPQIDR